MTPYGKPIIPKIGTPVTGGGSPQVGLNPGWMQAIPQYQTTDPAQARYFWGSAPFQAGATFDPNLAAQGIGAPAQAWGIQQAARAPTQLEMIDYWRNLTQANPYNPNRQQGFTVPGPVVPGWGKLF